VLAEEDALSAAALAQRPRAELFSSAVLASAVAHALFAAGVFALGSAERPASTTPPRVLRVALVGAPADTPEVPPPAAAPSEPVAKPPARVPPPPPRPARVVERAAPPRAPRPVPRSEPAAAAASTPPAAQPSAVAATPGPAAALSVATAAGPRAGAAPALVTARPRYKRSPEPPYPVDARRRRQEGTVLVAVHVTEAGAPRDVAVARSSGFAALDAAAVSAVARWEFEPGRRGEEAVASNVEVPIRFELR
jgi:protein TonB